MEFNRSSQSPFQRSGGPSSGSDSNTSTSTSSKPKSTNNDGSRGKLLKAGAMALLICIVIIVAAVLLLINFGDNSEAKLIDSTKLQAVFLNNGQVYFGKINTLNSNYVDLSNIYYLRTDSTNGQATSNSNISLVKLGCELHGPTDEMIINRSQVTFWENLKPSGQVAKAIASYQQQNPKGQNCNTQSSSGTQSAPNATTPSNTSGSSSSSTTTPSSTSTTPSSKTTTGSSTTKTTP